MNVKLTKQQRDYIKAKLKTGQYSNASEVVRILHGMQNLPRFFRPRN